MKTLQPIPMKKFVSALDKKIKKNDNIKNRKTKKWYHFHKHLNG